MCVRHLFVCAQAYAYMHVYLGESALKKYRWDPAYIHMRSNTVVNAYYFNADSWPICVKGKDEVMTNVQGSICTCNVTSSLLFHANKLAFYGYVYNCINTVCVRA